MWGWWRRTAERSRGCASRDGCLVLKVEYAGAAVQLRLRGRAAFPDGGGIELRHGFGLRIPQTVRRMLDFWSVAGLPVPRTGRLREGEDGALVKALDGKRAGRTQRQIAEDVFGKAAVEAEWDTSYWMRSQVRRWIAKADTLAEGGWRDLVPRDGSGE